MLHLETRGGHYGKNQWHQHPCDPYDYVVVIIWDRGIVKALHQDAVNTISIKAVISVILTTIVLILTKSHKKLSCGLALGSADVLCTTKSAEQ